MVLAHKAKLLPNDIDAVFLPKQEIYQAVADVVAVAGIEKDWLNDAAK